MDPVPFFKTHSPTVNMYQAIKYAGSTMRRLATTSSALAAASRLLESEDYRELLKSWPTAPTNMVFHYIKPGVYANYNLGNWNPLMPSKHFAIGALAGAGLLSGVLTGGAISQSDLEYLAHDVEKLKKEVAAATGDRKEELGKLLKVAQRRIRVHTLLVKGRFGTDVFFREIKRLIGMQTGPMYDAIFGFYSDPDNEYAQHQFWRAITQLGLGNATLADLAWAVGTDYPALSAKSAEDADLSKEQIRKRKKHRRDARGIGGIRSDPESRVMQAINQGRLPHVQEWRKMLQKSEESGGLGPLSQTPSAYLGMTLIGIRPHYYVGDEEETKQEMLKRTKEVVRDEFEPMMRNKLIADVRELKDKIKGARTRGDTTLIRSLQGKMAELQKMAKDLEARSELVVQAIHGSFREPLEQPQQNPYSGLGLEEE